MSTGRGNVESATGYATRSATGERKRRISRAGKEDGASLVEFAMVLPLLLTLLFGIIEMSWAFAQLNDVRHGAREGAREYAVDTGGMSAVAAEICDRMDVVSPSQNLDVVITPDGTFAEGSAGAIAEITITADLDTITGFFDFLLAGKTVSSTVEFRLEQPVAGTEATWWTDATSGAGTFSCP